MSRRALAALARGRRLAEALMVDMCAITRAAGQPGAIDPETGERTPPAATTVYSGQCKVQTFEAHETRAGSAGHVYTVQRYYVHIPVGAAVRVGDTVTITSAVADPNLVGRVYTVAGLLHKSMATAQRLLLDEVVD